MLDGDGMEEIKQLFFEESDEGLDTMETGLLNLDEGEADLEVINDIFRAAHSMKGGAATFAFTQIAEFTHHAETMLDEMRDGTRQVTSECIELLLKGVDCVREMMESAKEGEDVASQNTLDIRKQIEAVLAGEKPVETAKAQESAATDDLQGYIEGMVSSDTDNSEKSPNTSGEGWSITFKPHVDFLKFGNKPSLIFRELTELGELTVVSNVDDIPSLDEMDPQACYTSWSLELKGNIARPVLDSVFDWVDDDCDLDIQAMGEVTNGQDATVVEVEATQVVASENSIVESAPENKTVTEEPKAEKPKAKKAAKKKAASGSGTKSAGSIRVDIEKIDALLNLVGELVITQSMLKKVGGEISETMNENLESGLSQLETNARELQEVAMKMRMLPINNTFARFPRMVHDLCKQLDKKIDLEISGEHTELDKTVLEKVGDPLVHLVRNALDHGIETPDIRVAAGKPETGVMKLSAAHEAGNIVISISDDGAGINPDKVLAKARERGIVGEDESLTVEEINHLIFKAGFSTADVVSDVSGRGVGMDVVRRNIQDLGGRVEVESNFGKGSTFSIRLPLTMAILDGQLVRVGRETFVLPLLNIVESVLIDMNRVNPMGNSAAVYQLREQNIPIIRVKEVMGMTKVEREDALQGLENNILVIVDIGNEQVGLVVDELLDQQQVVIKSLETNYRQLDGLSGATILGDGTVALILDLSGLVNRCYRVADKSKGKTKELSGQTAVA